LPPNAVHVPGIFVDRVVQATEPKGFDIVATAPPPGTTGGPSPEELLEKSTRRRIAKRAAQELRDGFYVNLGVGIPTLVTEYLRPGVKIWLQSENGILGMGPFPTEDQVDPWVSLAVFSNDVGANSKITGTSRMLEKRRSLCCRALRSLVSDVNARVDGAC
jgi:3-oxoacid CoA-transferase